MKPIHLTGVMAPGPLHEVPQPLRAILLGLAALALASSSSAEQTADLPRPDDGYFQDIMKVGPGVWALVEPSFQVQPIGNVTIIEQSDGLVLVDAGGSPGSGRRIVAIV